MGDAETSCSIRLLGPLWVHPGLGVRDLGSPKQAAVLALLALRAGDVSHHDVLADAMWGPHPPRTYAHSLQLYVSGLRRLLDQAGSEVRIETVQRGYRLLVDPEQVDVVRFRRRVADGLRRGTVGEHERDAAFLEEALELWRGPPLFDVSLADRSEIGMSLAVLRLDALEGLAALRLAQGEVERAGAAAREVLAVDGLRERSRVVLMTALARAGRPAEALRSYEEARRLLDEELGTLPSAELRALHAEILRDEHLRGPAERDAGSGSRSSAPAPPSRSAKQARRTLTRVAGGVFVALAAAVAALSGWPPDGAAPTPASAGSLAILVRHGDVEGVNRQVEEGFDRAIAELGLPSEELFSEEPNAARVIGEQVSAGSIVFDFTLETDVAALARRHREATFVQLDDTVAVDEPNVATIRFSSHQGAFLAGFAAARTTRSGVVGFVGGVDFETIWPFEAGFVAGARAADPDVEIRVRYLSEPPRYGEGFENARAGERVAGEMFADGADVLFSAAGTSGLGVIEAAASRSTGRRHLWAIGVDTDQFETVRTLPGTADVERWRRHILTSVVLRFDTAVYATLKAFAAGDLEPGSHRYDLANGGVELSYSGGHLDAVRTELEEVRASLLRGDVSAPCRPERVQEAFAC